MYRDVPRRVRLAIMEGQDQAAADDVAQVPGQNRRVIRRAALFTQRMEAYLTGEGFRIQRLGPTRIDTGESGMAVWEWIVTPLRADKHYLRVEAYSIRRRGAQLVWGRPILYPPIEIAVPVRLFPERLGDAMDDSLAWFSRGESWLKALTALIAALGALWAAIRALGRHRVPATSVPTG